MGKRLFFIIFALVSVFIFTAALDFAGFCPECGTKCDDSAKFCTSCGAKLKQAEGTAKTGKEAKTDADDELPKIVEKVAPSVVLVRTLKNELNAQYQDMGSGFIVSKEGYIITNAHVIDDPEDLEGVKVVMSDKKEYEAGILLCDYQADLAVLRIQAEGIVPVKFGNVDILQSGEKVFAIGNPIGLERSTSSGIISAKGRYLGCYEYEGLLQTDAAVNPGNSGGPLFNMRGEVVGVTSLGYSKWYTEGLNFAIPAPLVLDTMKYIPAGKVKRPWIGIAVQDLTPDLKQWEEAAHERKITETDGVFIASIAEGKELPFKKGDIVVKLDEMSIKKVWDLQKEILGRKIGDELSVTVLRNGKEMNFKVKMTEKPLQARFPVEDEVDIMFGATFSKGSGGAKIEKVRSKCLAVGMGLKEGWEITTVLVNKKKGGDRLETGSVENFYNAFRSAYNYELKYIEWEIYFNKNDGGEWSKYYYPWRQEYVAMNST
ncbi:hypothetical protein AUJ67_09990 [Candidatus Desantisbacteria bacterium CG1_02_49_89]|nr:MAG: hypothetical protein AUJ67_09990 [Candidatus Desantisbacteria bacterium CG1_02_49_89]